MRTKVGILILDAYNADMRWALVIFIILFMLLQAMPALKRIGLGRLPGDISFRLGRRQIEIPLASTILLAFVALLLGKLM